MQQGFGLSSLLRHPQQDRPVLCPRIVLPLHVFVQSPDAGLALPNHHAQGHSLVCARLGPIAGYHQVTVVTKDRRT